MIIDFDCPLCNEPLRVFHEDAGKPAQCPRCDWRFVLPQRPGELTQPLSDKSADIQLVVPLDAKKIRDLRAGQKLNELHKAMTQEPRDRNWVYHYFMIKLILWTVPLLFFVIVAGCVVVLGNVFKASETNRQPTTTTSGPRE
jgi:hypothetical protein